MYYFYILRSLKNGRLYLGFTPDLKARVQSHNNGENKATKPNAPYELISYSAFKSKHDAVNCEQHFKTTAGWKRLRKMLEHTLKDKKTKHDARRIDNISKNLNRYNQQLELPV